MIARVCSAYSDKELEQKIQRTIEDGEERGFSLVQVCYSTSFNTTASGHVPNKDYFFRSAILIFNNPK